MGHWEFNTQKCHGQEDHSQAQEAPVTHQSFQPYKDSNGQCIAINMKVSNGTFSYKVSLI